MEILPKKKKTGTFFFFFSYFQSQQSLGLLFGTAEIRVQRETSLSSSVLCCKSTWGKTISGLKMCRHPSALGADDTQSQGRPEGELMSKCTPQVHSPVLGIPFTFASQG